MVPKYLIFIEKVFSVTITVVKRFHCIIILLSEAKFIEIVFLMEST